MKWNQSSLKFLTKRRQFLMTPPQEVVILIVRRGWPTCCFSTSRLSRSGPRGWIGPLSSEYEKFIIKFIKEGRMNVFICKVFYRRLEVIGQLYLITKTLSNYWNVSIALRLKVWSSIGSQKLSLYSEGCVFQIFPQLTLHIFVRVTPLSPGA